MKVFLFLALATLSYAQGPRPTDLGESDLPLGDPGIAWYPELAQGLAEAKRTNKPILFMAVASQCGGISGVF
ncbi:thioredoxin family protein [Akkermansiaceae bacterium]|nr:thioredoxin family protein [Akkermansiaceae bacterium]MDB4317180.1 thioredoxin family protein [bacterium]MDA7863483.1 thioredoxin family protein [Akkermansiaceae bacterium]MDA7931651.1 thioredoxin family protein [Akkermansiaceae bacterium]MDA8968693.1 thioredoxin family protein [Akkermansiaceae bacterium]